MTSHHLHSEPTHATAPGNTVFHLGVLLVCVLVLVLSRALTLQGQQLSLSSLPNSTLPDVCFFHAATGWDCPFCGLTRSFVAISHGHWHAALSYHRMAWLLFILVLAQFPYRTALILMPTLSQSRGVRWIQQWTLKVLLVLAVANWIIGWFC